VHTVHNVHNVQKVHNNTEPPEDKSTPTPDTEAPIYIIYTSGTTGRPKGVIIRNRNLINYVNWFTAKNQITNQDRSILTSSFAFDLGYTAIYPPLLKGGQLHIPQKKHYLNPAKLLEYIATNGITYLKMTPSLFSTIVNKAGFTGENLKTLRLVVLGGEPIEVNDIEKAHHQHKSIKIMNHYGPTEATIGCVARLVDFDDLKAYRQTTTIGKPIANTAVYILNSRLKLVPVGVAGELSVSGDSVAAGYLNHPELTKKKFPNNQSPITNNYLYKTGDRARWQPDGN
ncbi:MAG: amino acid adenylation domain-containing protein, partial [bacterium]|nr:amino acid adenylation domain-containing protein [bacterium]